MREGDALEAAIRWSAEQGLIFDAVNDNLEAEKKSWGNNPRKVYADYYIDDHNIRPEDFVNRKISRPSHKRQKLSRQKAQKGGVQEDGRTE